MLNFAIVGCGHVAKKHVQAINNSEGARLYALCDANANQLQQFGSTYDIKHLFTSFEKLLDQQEIDIISICTPSGTHRKLAIQAANAKKHIVLEKPMALTLTDADAILKACDENDVKLTVVHPNRFRPAVVALKQAIQENKFGTISYVNATLRWNRNQAYYDQASWRGTKEQDGGVLMNQAIHNLDLLLWLIGDVEQVQAYMDTRIRNIEAEDVATAILRFKDGMLGVIEATSTIYPKNLEESISIFGETGSAEIGGPTANWIKHWVFDHETEAETEKIMGKVENDPFGIPGHQMIIQDMIKAVEQDRAPIVTGEDGRNALALVLAIYHAAEQNSPYELQWKGEEKEDGND
ncbi:putative dehydrogenase [Salirhabdus euzebyi]|uniref:Putative dehydrogenase n=1 Tax=Salirhabdus euzebyi TaxID=394506 RepID=A0A841Q4G0_9BACI|nr:Gfo/Idh/MocA family oxidoreductase [Salirhabdus euzebyi]MBB6453296.1 putative dehydrogenase [Salirhabdus euzebyi]